MDGMRALVIEDDESIAKLNKYLLGLEGFDVDVGATAGEAVVLRTPMIMR